MTLECDCGTIVFTGDVFYEGESAVCPSCGAECTISVDESVTVGEYDGEPLGRASVHCGETFDVSQQNCDGSCGAVQNYVAEGHRCTMECDRITPEQRERFDNRDASVAASKKAGSS